MVDLPRSPATACVCRFRVARLLAKVLMVCLPAGPVLAQGAGVHYRHHGLMPPGAIGSAQLERGGPLPGYFQPVEIRAPEGTRISLVVDGTFGEPLAAPVTAGMLIGAVYRLRVSNIPLAEGLEVFPTIEVIDRLYTPAGEARRFPIPLELNEDDLRLALEGKFVTRVIYLEDPGLALPIALREDESNWFEVAPGVDPLQEADHWGRPVAIVRLGARVPADHEMLDPSFVRGSPPFTLFRPWIEPAGELPPAEAPAPLEEGRPRLPYRDRFQADGSGAHGAGEMRRR